MASSKNTVSAAPRKSRKAQAHTMTDPSPSPTFDQLVRKAAEALDEAREHAGTEKGHALVAIGNSYTGLAGTLLGARTCC